MNYKNCSPNHKRAGKKYGLCYTIEARRYHKDIFLTCTVIIKNTAATIK